MLTLKQRAVYQFIQEFMQANEFAPTGSEIAKAIGITSCGVVHRYLRALEEAGLIQLEAKRHRNIRLRSNKQRNSGNEIPLLGTIAAGLPIEAVQIAESIGVTADLAGNDHFALRVQGDSMQDEHIVDGDIIICKPTSVVENGQVVVALIDGDQATLKYYHQADGMITLLSANKSYPPQQYEADRVVIQALFFGLIRLEKIMIG